MSGTVNPWSFPLGTTAPGTIQDICVEALATAGAFTQGQAIQVLDLQIALQKLANIQNVWSYLTTLVYRQSVVSVLCVPGRTTYTVGPGQNFDTGFAASRPAKVELAWLRKGDGQADPTIVPASAPGNTQVDYPLEILRSWEDYGAVPLKGLTTMPTALWYDNQWPTGTLYLSPVAPDSTYALFVGFSAPLGSSFPALTDTYSLPPEYRKALVDNLALELRKHYRIPTFQGDTLARDAKSGKLVLTRVNAKLATIRLPTALSRPGAAYNIFSDQPQ